MKGYVQASLADMIDAIGEEKTQSILSGFHCPLNRDVERFLREKAIQFDKQGISKTHLVFCSKNESVPLVGYFALANKLFIVRKGSNLSSRLRSRLNKFATYNEQLKRYEFAAPLIGQLGKNYADGVDSLITGDDLLELACRKIRELHSIAGGRIAYLECENNARLIRFYESNGFAVFDQRPLDDEERADIPGHYLVQMIKYFN